MRIGLYLGCAALTLLSACHAVPRYPTPQDKFDTNRAVAPSSQQAAEAEATAAIKAQLRDPDSAKITFGQVKHGTVILFDMHHNGYFLCGTVNSKNGYGGYVGAQDYVVFFGPYYPDATAEALIDTQGTGFYQNVCLTYWRAE